ncbi:hypothetical protein ILYODFUR_017279 [Ilyodon furcidens]|uniref:Uncharacterized protein n=1 Tax=Ilyodon furcidens TaxID=33524 RepID=A0ABV0TN11_9TELE
MDVLIFLPSSGGSIIFILSINTDRCLLWSAADGSYNGNEELVLPLIKDECLIIQHRPRQFKSLTREFSPP